jgi:formamidopyrimidine-DNA glycosylase
MPELPEVETIARGVDARVRGDRIVEAWFSGLKEPFRTLPAVQAKGLEGCWILSVRRVGKHIVFALSSLPKLPGARSRQVDPFDKSPIEPDREWIVHLGMTGRLLVTTPDAELAPHTHARLRLKSGRELRFVDARRFGRLEFREVAKVKAFEAAGREPLTIGQQEFASLFRGRKLAIKAALLNQTLLSGVGNIYADESLFRAGIRPRRQAGRLTKSQLEKLRLGLIDVLKHAIRLGGSSVSDYVDAEGVRGFFQLEHCVYQRTGQPCLRCGSPVRRVIVAGRSTHYCPHCQK